MIAVTRSGDKPELGLDARLAAIVAQDYPKFTSGEMARRRARMAQAMEAAGVDHLVAYAAFFSGGPVHWLSDWLTTFEAVLVYTPGRKDTIFVQFYNHVPQARAVMPEADVRWGGAASIQSAIAELRARGAKPGRVGVVGGLPMGPYKALCGAFEDAVDLNRAYLALRLVKSPEEIDRHRIGARLSDLPIEALARELRPGLDEADLAAITEAAYGPWRGRNVIHFFGVTSMHDPQVCVPRQHLGTRKIAAGDVISCEITANFWEYGGQVLRTFTVGEPFTPLYRRLHDTAEAAFDAIFAVLRPGAHVRELAVGVRLIEEAGFSFYDDLVHGFGGAYLAPVIGSPKRSDHSLPDMTLEAGVMMVIQPNVITADEKAGVQTGELVLVTGSGAESLHTAARGAIHVGA
jgi:Xaa-Pro aminopeptidase